MIGGLDLPVFKHEGLAIPDTRIKGGYHVGGIMLIPHGSRLEAEGESFAQHVTRWHEELNRGAGLCRIHVERIIHDPERVSDYTFKCLHHRVGQDELILLPRPVSELPERGPPKRKDPEPTFVPAGRGQFSL